ncbi:DUF5060 domain-containing protein [Alienimonas chondri]|uniref:DUF5060 domain-containing protein n=1 Tax=Alienimonas chondri TaxID=2681879 RepID=A0ABX1VIA2_9PLAN|nr:DUF5060 domain-containing protein [Alienimonas chondri]NNJ27585.1 hypothetical protein [Alienimonas chondri]
MFAPALLLAAPLLWSAAVPPAEPVERRSDEPPTAPVYIDGKIDGAYRVGFPIAFTLTGPEALQENGEANPFVDYRLTASFGRPDRADVDGRVVPGYFAADGRAGETGAEAGARWRAHYRPTWRGRTTYRLVLRKGDELIAEASGTIEVKAPPEAVENARDFRRRGQLTAWEGRLMLATPERLPTEWTPFFKTGAGSPENLLAYADFDGTWSAKSDPRDGESHSEALHRYEPHLGDWNDGDPAWRDGRGKGLIGALNYLADAGVNSLYFVPFNVAGDGRDVWPHAATEGEEPTDLTRFDCSKLDQWETVFTHCDTLGIALHMLLTETENEALFERRTGPGADYEQTGVPFAETRKLYYREMIARFGHHPAIIWNLGEENGRGKELVKDGDGRDTTDAQRKAFAAYIKQTDPYDHPLVVHTYPNWQNAVYMPLLGDRSFDGVSLQLSPMSQTRDQTLKWTARSAATGRPWFVCLDEVGPANAGVLPDDADGAAENHRAVRRALWANLLSGGSGAEWYFGYKFPHNDLNLEDFRSRANVWRFSKIAREFAEREGLADYYPVRDYFDADEVFAVRKTELAPFQSPPGSTTTLVYVPAGRKPFVPVPFESRCPVRWFDVENGGAWQTGAVKTVEGGAAVDPGEPPGRTRDRDWILRIGG